MVSVYKVRQLKPVKRFFHYERVLSFLVDVLLNAVQFRVFIPASHSIDHVVQHSHTQVLTLGVHGGHWGPAVGVRVIPDK